MSALQSQVEEWRDVPGYPGYEVSSLGRVRSWRPIRNFAKAPHEPRLLSTKKDRYGYWRVSLYANKRRSDLCVHAVVCEAWHGQRPSGMQTRHLDGNKENNTPGNLAWGSAQENSEDRDLHGTQVRGGEINTAKLSEDDVRKIRRTKGTCKQIADQFGVSFSTISHIKNNRTWTHVI